MGWEAAAQAVLAKNGGAANMSPFTQFINQNNLSSDDPNVMKKDSTILAAREISS